MSFDLDNLAQKYGLTVASIKFATSSDVAGLSFIPASAGVSPVIHYILFTASAWANVQLGRSTAAASSYWTGFAGQNALREGVRIVGDNNASIVADVASVGVTTGSGVLRVWYTKQSTVGRADLGAL